MSLNPFDAKRTRYIGFGLLYVAFCICFVDRAAMAIALSHVGKEYALSPAELGMILSSFYLGYTFMQLPGGVLADRFGSKYVVIVTIAAWSVFTVVTGLAWSFAALVAIRFIFGLAEGAFPSASIKAIAEFYSATQRPKMVTALMSSNYIGSMVAPLLIAPLLIYFGWRHTFFVIGAAGVLFALCYYVGVPHKKPVVAATTVRDPADSGLKGLFATPLLWQLLVIWFGLSCVNKGLDAWMPTYLLQVRGLDLKALGLLTPLPFVMAAVATGIGGWVMVTFFDGREKYLLLGSAFLTGLCLYYMYKSASVSGVIFFQCLVYFFKSFVFAAVFALPTKLLPEGLIGSGIGMINLGGQGAGFVAPLAMGLLVNAFGTYDAAFVFLLAATALSTLVALTVGTRARVAAPAPLTAA